MKVGDYVRTDIGIIQKIDKIYKQNETDDTHIQLNRAGTGKSIFILDNDKELSYSKGEVIKSSPNIIDLIEDGDYVNGCLVLNVLEFNDNSRIISLEKIYDNKIIEEEIKSIVTKEQFESMEYKVGSDKE